MLKRIFYCCILLFQYLNSNAQADSLKEPVENALIWKIEGNGIQHPSYLMGTMHAIPIGNIDTSKKLKDLIFSCTTLFTEASDSLFMTTAFLPGNDYIKNHLKKRHYKQLKKAIEFHSPNSLETDSIFRMNPYLYRNILLGYQAKVYFTAYEEYLIITANSKNIPIDGLETSEELTWLRKKYPMQEDGFSHLSDFIDNIDFLLEQFKKEFRAYAQHNINYIYYHQQKINTEFVTDIVDKRNLIWLPKIKLAIKKESCFFAVGAAHLAGANGVVNLLRKEGYLVTPAN